MARTRAWLPFAFALLLPCSLASAQEVASPPATEPPPGDEPAATIEDVIVVTASRTEQKLVDAPATMTVFTAEDIQSIPADDYGDLLRNVPGMNVTQTSARDIQMTGRGSTNTLATTQLVMLDGRSIYLDFFGFVMWDFLPVNPAEIKQIEAVRGPGSAVWGANAMTGVVNLITKRPQEMLGTSLLLGGGEIGTEYASLSHAGGSDRFGYKVSGGYYAQDAYERPSGNIPGTEIPYSSFAFPNSGTEQAKGDLRLSWDLQNGSTFDVAAGYAATDGIVHTGIGPFDVESGSHLSYGKLDWNRSALHVGFFANFLDADSVNLLTRSGNGQPLGFAFATDTYNADISNTSVLGGDHHIVTYGANYRTNDFELEIAPQGTERDEWGVFLQDEILFGSKVRWVIGGRYDEVDPLEKGVFTPRTSLIISPSSRHTWRVSYNEAFRTPSAINSYLDVTILQPVPIPGVGTFALPADANGNIDLVEEHMTAYEVGYVGTYGNNVILTLAAYRNETEDSIDFFTARTYGFGNLPAPSPLFPAALIPCFNFPNPFVPTPAACGPGFGGRVPSNYSYRNIGKTIDRGVEASLQQRHGAWSWFANASWQDEPEFEGLDDISEQNLPPTWRANLGLGYDPGRWFFDVNANYQDEAFWGDVLFAHGTTDAFTMVNVSTGVRLWEERVTLQVIGANIFDEEVQQHVFGDIISRKITGQIGINF
ncbi:MAG TPA: TonB-dependent receptor [Thermoanaerobaculia bacterium]|nr:TonB-dependent receptor [Thermoanaerobaculia bacterium]